MLCFLRQIPYAALQAEPAAGSQTATLFQSSPRRGNSAGVTIVWQSIVQIGHIFSFVTVQ